MIKKEDNKTLAKTISILSNTYKNELILFTFIVSFYILFHYPINSLLTKFLIDTCLKYIYAEKWYNDIIFYFVIIILLYRTYKHWHKQYYVNNTYALLFSFTIIYSINRSIGTWNFHSTYLIKSISYSDILFILSLLSVVLIFKTQYSKKQSNTILQSDEKFGFITDNPINEQEDDKLQYTNYASSIASKILLTKTKKSFAIGINGKWGTGKTSFFNLIKKNIESNEEVILIDFSPWNTENFKSIMTDFFETLEDNLINYNSNISKKISDYSEKLLILNEIETTKPVFNLFKVFFGKNKTLTELKKDLEKNIEKLDKKLIIFIDDLDRLDNSEINEVLKLIRNTADFKNTFFIVAYDRNYVVNSLTALNTYNKEGFLEKIFQLEINLPYYEKKELCIKLYANLIQFFPDKKELIERSILTESGEGEVNLLHQNINSMRDVILISNSIILNYENLKGNVDFKNLLYLEILRIKYPNIYEILKNKNNEFVYIENYKKGVYNLKLSDNNPQLFNALRTSNLEVDIEYLNINKIEEIINELFNINKINFLSLINISKYENYFSYRLLEKTLDENEFKETISKDLTSIKTQITTWITKGYEFDLVRRFSSINTYESKIDYQNKLNLIFYIAKQKSNKSENIIGFDSDIIQRRFGYYSNFKDINYSFAEHKKFVENLLLKAELPFTFEANLIHELNSKVNNSSSYKFPLKKEDFEKISETYLDNYIEKSNVINKNLLHILSANSITKNYPLNKPDFSNNIREKVINYFNSQQTDDLIKICINKNGNRYNITPMLFGIFESTLRLRNYFNERTSEDKSELCNEFLIFLSNLGSENSSIRYEFETEI